MKIIHIPQINTIQAISQLKQDNVLIAQTDTIIGLICLSSSTTAQQKIFDMKQRGSSTPLALLVNGLEMAQRYAQFDECAIELFKTLEGKITLILSIKPEYENKLGLNGSIGIRYTNSQALRQLMHEVDEAICATSANIHGEPHATTLKEAYEIFNCPILETENTLETDEVKKQIKESLSLQDHSKNTQLNNIEDNMNIPEHSTPSILLNLTQTDIITISRLDITVHQEILSTIKEIARKYNKTIKI